MPRMREAIRSGWNHSSASSFSPTDASLIGRPVTALTDSAAPPRASPSSFVRSDAVEVDALLERLRDVDGLLAGHRVEHEEDVRRLRLAAHGGELLHQRLVDVQPAGGVEDDDVAAVRLRALDAVADRLDRVGALVGVDGDPDLRAELHELVDRGRAAAGRRRRARACCPSLLEQQRELAGGGRLARALQAGEQDRRRRPRREGELRGARAHERGQLLVDDLHDLLAGRQALRDVLAERALAHAARRTRLTTSRLTSASSRARRTSRIAREIASSSRRSAAAKVAEGALELVGEGVEHASGQGTGSQRTAVDTARHRPQAPCVGSRNATA